jgi:HSP20 family protein
MHREKPSGEAVYCEACPDDYRRVFEIASDIDTSKISAHMDQGILKLRLPKSERFKPRKIAITE